ncbi:MAG: hypothetical protein ABH863_04120 [Candidatus Micrarchaeota archaeon]
MNDSVKLYIVNCGGCNSKQVWDSGMKFRPCAECNSTVVLKTASPEDLLEVKAAVGPSVIRFSNYFVYSFGVEDVEEAVAIKRERVKKMKTDVEDRKKFAQMERMNFSLNGNGERRLNGNNGAGPLDGKVGNGLRGGVYGMQKPKSAQGIKRKSGKRSR